MLNDTDQLFELILTTINEVRGTDFCPETVEVDSFLGGELGIDSREMLEIWYEVEKRLGLNVHDYDKRDIYTIQDCIRVFQKYLNAQMATA